MTQEFNFTLKDIISEEYEVASITRIDNNEETVLYDEGFLKYKHPLDKI